MARLGGLGYDPDDDPLKPPSPPLRGKSVPVPIPTSSGVLTIYFTREMNLMGPRSMSSESSERYERGGGVLEKLEDALKSGKLPEGYTPVKAFPFKLHTGQVFGCVQISGSGEGPLIAIQEINNLGISISILQSDGS